jgi:putative flippase GtrA
MADTATLRRFIKYTIVGGIGTLVHYLILIVLVAAHLTGPVVATVVGALCGAIFNYFLNARITFKKIANLVSIRRFALIAILGAAINGLLMAIQIHFLMVNYLVAQAVATAVVLGLTYSLNTLWTFRSGTARRERGL